MNVHKRVFPAAFAVSDFETEGDGRTVLGRIVPYNEPISFVDPYDGMAVKREMFVPGAFSKQSNPGAWSRVGLSYHHDEGWSNTIGYGRGIQERDDGAYATFRLYEQDASKAREMMANTHQGLSLEFEPRGQERTSPDGVILRDNVRVLRVGITDDPAYTGAKVLAVRESSVDDEDEGARERLVAPHLVEVRAQLAALRRDAP